MTTFAAFRFESVEERSRSTSVREGAALVALAIGPSAAIPGIASAQTRSDVRTDDTALMDIRPTRLKKSLLKISFTVVPFSKFYCDIIFGRRLRLP